MRELFDIWILDFDLGAGNPVDGLMRVFGVDQATARQLVQTVPRRVKHGASSDVADATRQALESIGARVECRPAGAPSAAGMRPVAAEPVATRASAAPSHTLPPVSLAPSGAYLQPSHAPLPPLEEKRSGGLSALLSSYGAFVLEALIGVAIVKIGLALDDSVFLGNGSLFGVFFDAVAISALLTAAAGAVALPLFGRRLAIKQTNYMMAIPALGISLACNHFISLGAYSEVELADMEAAETASAPQVEARRFIASSRTAFVDVDKDIVGSLVNDFYAAGATEVNVLEPVRVSGTSLTLGGTLRVLLPDDPVVRDRLRRRYLRFVGVHADYFDPEEAAIAAGQREWIVDVGFD